MTRLRLTPLETRDTPVAGYTAAGAAAGGLPLVAVFRPDGSTLAQVPAFETSFRGGVTAAVAELDGDPNTQEVVVGAGPGGGPAVKVYSVDVQTGAVFSRSAFYAFEPTFTGGVRVAAGNVTARTDGLDQIVLGAGAGGGPRVRTVDINGVAVDGALADFFAFEPTFRGGVQVAAGELDNNTSDGTELVVTPDDGGGPRVRVLRSDGAVLADYFAFNPAFRGGANVQVSSGRIVTDAFALDPSQRNAALNTAAGAVGTTATTTTTTSGGISGATNASGVTATTAGTGLGSTSATGLTSGTAATGFGTLATGGGVTAATGATNVSGQVLGGSGFTSQTTGTGGFATQTTGATGLGTQSTTAGGVTSATTAGGLTSTGLDDTGVITTTTLTGPTTLAFGPFGDPGPALPAPALATPPFVRGVRYAIPV